MAAPPTESAAPDAAAAAPAEDAHDRLQALAVDLGISNGPDPSAGGGAAGGGNTSVLADADVRDRLASLLADTSSGGGGAGAAAGGSGDADSDARLKALAGELGVTPGDDLDAIRVRLSSLAAEVSTMHSGDGTRKFSPLEIDDSERKRKKSKAGKKKHKRHSDGGSKGGKGKDDGAGAQEASTGCCCVVM